MWKHTRPWTAPLNTWSLFFHINAEAVSLGLRAGILVCPRSAPVNLYQKIFSNLRSALKWGKIPNAVIWLYVECVLNKRCTYDTHELSHCLHCIQNASRFQDTFKDLHLGRLETSHRTRYLDDWKAGLAAWWLRMMSRLYNVASMREYAGPELQKQPANSHPNH